jgi:hypothetical protein
VYEDVLELCKNAYLGGSFSMNINDFGKGNRKMPEDRLEYTTADEDS